MRTECKFLCLLTFLLIATNLFGQTGYNLSGVVINEKGEPLKSATVFIGGSQRITPTDENGQFKFQNISAGTFNLSVQMLGYTPLTRNVIIKAASYNIEIRLQPKIISLDEVVIGSGRGWNNNFDLFKEQFLGRSRNAQQCIILNPKIINFATKKGSFSADADDFLVIENKRLGYRIRYLLQDFSYDMASHITQYHGECSFEELNGTEEQQKAWATNRSETYKGSFRHFLRTVYANNTLENGFIARPLYRNAKLNKLEDLEDPFRLMVINKPVRFDTLITAIDSNFISLKFKRLYVIYDPKKAAAYQSAEADKNRSVIIQEKTVVFDRDASALSLLNDQAIVDKKGSYTDYRSFFIKGLWAQARMGDELPIEYVPPFADLPRGNVPVNKPAFALQNWLESMPQEKAYLHMDKPYYALGDTIWFKGYLTTGSRHQLSARSGAVYLDLINDQNQRVKTFKFPVNSGTVAGSLILGDDINSGSYRIRAYTQWMRNAGEEYFFTKTFTIGNASATDKNKKDIKNSSQIIDVQFFPESGSLISGITSKVGFKAVSADGIGEAVTGTIIDNENKGVATISTLHAGMGSFFFKPLPGKTYTANIISADGHTQNTVLPRPLNDGYALCVYQPNKDSILVRILASPSLQQSKVNLIVHSSGELILTSQIDINSAVTSIWLDKSAFPSGIAQFTLFNADNEPLNERIAFIKNNDHMQLTISTDKATYKSREHVELNLDAKDSGGLPVGANFSIAVIDEDKVPTNESAESTIFSSILLTSDIKGYIEKPNYYFMSDTDKVNEALDNLMLTQGYRRFEWRPLISTIKTRPMLAVEESAVSASGTVGSSSRRALPNANMLISKVVSDSKFAVEGIGTTISGSVITLTHKPLSNVAVLLVSTNARINRTTITDAGGRFKFDNLVFADSAKFAVQAKGPKNNDHAIIILDTLPQVPITTKNDLASTQIIKSIIQRAEEEGKPAKLTGLHVLKQVDIKAMKNKVNQDITPQGMFKLPDEESADKVITVPDDEPSLTLSMFLQAKIPGVRVETDQVHTQLVDMRSNISFDPKAVEPVTHDGLGVTLDGRQLTKDEADEVLNGGLLPQDVARILVVRTNLAVVNFWGKGIYIITKLASSRKQYNPNIANITPKGYNKARQFYSPRYDRLNDNTFVRPDSRTTIFWDPYLNTDANGKASLFFFNADEPGKYRVVIEGITATGELGRRVFSYKVE